MKIVYSRALVAKLGLEAAKLQSGLGCAEENKQEEQEKDKDSDTNETIREQFILKWKLEDWNKLVCCVVDRVRRASSSSVSENELCTYTSLFASTLIMCDNRGSNTMEALWSR